MTGLTVLTLIASTGWRPLQTILDPRNKGRLPLCLSAGEDHTDWYQRRTVTHARVAEEFGHVHNGRAP